MMQLDTMQGMSLDERNAALTTWLNDLTTVYEQCAAQRTDLLAVAESCLSFFAWQRAQHSNVAPDDAWLAPLKSAIAKARGEHV